ncbi:MAG: glycosyltransferase [archaeon]|nr:glycosyltransferase [archaeon]
METAYREQMHILQSLGIDVRLNCKDKCDLIHIHYLGLHSYYLSKRAKVPVIMTAHTMPGELRYLYEFGNIAEKIGRYCLGKLYNTADVVIAPTNFTKDMLELMNIDRPIEVISNGIDCEKFQFSQEKRNLFREIYKIQHHEKVVYSIGLMAHRKGFDKFLAIAKKMKQYKFVWVGKKGIALLHRNSFLNMIINKNAPDNFIKTGYVNDVAAAHCAGDVFLFPSHFETQGLVALEAAACSRPMVVENIPSFEWLGKSCFRAKTVDEYCAQIEKAMERNIDIQNHSRMLVKENNIINTGKLMIELYERTLSN